MPKRCTVGKSILTPILDNPNKPRIYFSYPMKKILCFALIASLALSSSCSTTTKVTGLSDLPKMTTSTTGVALPIQLESTSPFGEQGCSLFVSRSGELKTYEIAFNPGKDVIVSEIPAGVYGYKEIYCGGRHWDLTHKGWPRFQAFEGKIAVLGGVSIYLNETGSMSTNLSNREKCRDEALKLLGRIPTESKANLVSAYTGQPISATAIESPARWKHWEVTDPAGKKIKKDERDWPSFHSCYRGEDDINALWLGNLEFAVDYDKANLVEARQSETWHTFSGHFVDCVKASLKDFHPRTKGRLHYVLYI